MERSPALSNFWTGPSAAGMITGMRGLARLAVLLTLGACGGASGVVRILEVNDIHIRDEASAVYPARVVAAINREGADLALVCGDVATDGKEGELLGARRVLDGLAVPYRIVIGNREGREISTEFRAVPLQDGKSIRVGPAEGGAAIQKAVQALRDGGTIVLTEGEYRLSRGIRLDRVRGLEIRAEGKVRLVLEPAPVVTLRSAAAAGARRIVLEKWDGLYTGAELEFTRPPWKGTPSLRVTAVGADGAVDLSAELPADVAAGATAMVLENLIHLTEVEDVTISGLELDLQRERQPFAPVNHTRQCGILVTAPYNHEKGTSSPSRRVRLLDCTVRNAHHRGIALYATEDSEVSRCRVEAVGAEGIDLDHYCRRIRVDACTVASAGLSGIEINDGADCTVSASTVERCPVGIKVWHYLPCRMEGANRGNRILRNTIRASGSAGIWMGKEVDGNTLEGNLVEGVEKGPGVLLQGKGNAVRGTTVKDAPGGGVVDRGEGNDVRP